MTLGPNIIVITSCTSRKKNTGPVLALADTDKATSLEALARGWHAQIKAVSSCRLLPAAQLYGGRSIAQARKTAELLGAPLYIVSAGHGLVHGDELIPAYDVTVTPAADNRLHQCLLRLGKTGADWWKALVEELGQQRGLANLIASSKNATVLIALPSAYLTLLSSDLDELTDADCKRVRLITSPRGVSTLPERLRHVAMPYDERLEGIPAYAGTRSDFPQRALHHFVAILNGHKLALRDAHARVLDAMNLSFKPSLPQRQRKTDDEIKALLLENWNQFNGSATALLRYLRDEALVSCEQSRFRDLRRELVSELNDGVGK